MSNDPFKLFELHTKLEPLCDELKPYIHKGPTGEMIHHPLIIEMFYDPERCALINTRYEHKKEARQEAQMKGNWSTYIFVHERPYRIRALRYILSYGVTDKQIADLVSQAWIDSENIWQHKDDWIKIWSSLKNPHLTMDHNEKTVFDMMPETVTIHRGVRHFTHNKRGLSWTRDKERAVWFANRWRDKKNCIPAVYSATVKKKYVLAFFMGRHEEEVVVLPKHLRNVKLDTLYDEQQTKIQVETATAVSPTADLRQVD